LASLPQPTGPSPTFVHGGNDPVTPADDGKAVVSYTRVLHCVSCASSTSRSAPLCRVRCRVRGKSSTETRKTRPSTQRRGTFRLSYYCMSPRVPGSRFRARSWYKLCRFRATYRVTCARVTVHHLRRVQITGPFIATTSATNLHRVKRDMILGYGR
jgi:hypothetical protein